MKFSYAIMNPPYDRNLHLKFLEKVIKVADKTVNISPVRWLQDPFAKDRKSSDYNKFENSVAKKIESLEILTASESSGLFSNVSLTMDLGIYVCTDKGGYEYDKTDPLIDKIIAKTKESTWAPYSQRDFYLNGCVQKKPYVLNVSRITAILMNKTYESQLNVQLAKETSVFRENGGNGDGGGHFEFDTEQERRNFYDCYSTPFMKWHTSLWKSNPKIYCYKIPYFGDYTKPWTNARFCEYFGITGFISDTEAEPGSEWETILKTMKKYA